MSDPLGLEEADPLGLAESDPLGLLDKKKKSGAEELSEMSLPRRALSGAVGGPQAVGSMLSTIPAMAIGGLHGLGKLATGSGMDEAAKAVQGTTDALTYEPGTAAGRMLTEGAGEGFDYAKGKAGDWLAFQAKEAAAGEAARKAGRPIPTPGSQETAQTQLDPKQEALYRGAGEAGFEGMAAAGPVLHMAPKRFPKSVTEAAQATLNQKMAGESEYSSWETYAKERTDYLDALRELDNAVVKYPKDLQAPQLGGGGRVAHPPDMKGKAIRGEYANQMAFDEEMRKTGEEYQDVRNDAHEASLEKGVDQLGQYGPSYEGTTQDHAPSTVRPMQREQVRPGIISEGEATKIYLKPKFERTLEDKLKLQEYEDSLKGPSIDSVGSDGGYPHFKSYDEGLWKLQNKLPDAMAGVDRTTYREQVEHVANNSGNAMYRAVAKLLLSDGKWNPDWGFSKDLDSPTFAAQFNHSRYRIEIKPEHAGSEVMVIHEAVHSRTAGAIELALRNPKSYPELQAPVKRLQTLFTNFASDFNISFPGKTEPYGLTNIHEFVAEAFANPHFQEILRSTPMNRSLRGSLRMAAQTYWDAFVEGLAKILGFKPHTADYLSEVLQAGAEIISKDSTDTRTAFADELTKNSIHAGIYGAYEYKDFKNDLKAKGLDLPEKQMRAMFDKSQPAPKDVPAHPSADAMETIKEVPGLKKIQEQYADKRTWEQVLPIIQKAKDVSMVSANVVAKMIQGKFTASDHPLWSWTSSQVHWIKNNSLLDSNKVLHGPDRKNPAPGTYNHMWNLLKREERTELNRAGQAFNNKEGRASPEDLQQWARKELGHELTKHQLKSYEDRVRINKEVLENVINKRLVEEGKQPIPALPNYWSPNVFDGPFLALFKDKATGETIKIHSSYTRPNEKALAKAFPDYNLEIKETGLKKGLDFDQLDWVLRHLDKEMRDPAAKAIAEGLRRQGFMKHGLKRRGVEGGEGTVGKNAMKKYEEVAEKYIRGAFEWKANRDLDKLHNTILDEKSINNQPYAKGYALEAVDTARGGANKSMEDFSRFTGDILRGTIQVGTLGMLKLPNRFQRDLLRYSNKVGTTLILGFGNLTNIAAQLLQMPMYAPVKGLAMGIESGQPLAVFKAMASASKEMTKWDDSKDIQKLKETGVLDPTFKYDFSTYASDSDPRWKNTLTDHLTGVSTLSYIESNAVRRPAALFFLHMLRELGYDAIAKDKNEIYHVAKELTDHYMVSTKWFEKPHMFSRTGIVGTALSPLQSFATTWAGMLREYTRLSASGLLEGSVVKSAPLAAFMASNLLTAGMLGLVGVKEWDALATFLNDHFGYNVPTGTQFVMSKFKDETTRFGLLSSQLGVHIGATFNAPTLAGSFAIGGQTIWNAIKAVFRGGQYAGNQMGMNDAPESYQMRDAMKGVTPRFSPVPGFNWGDIERQETPKGLPYQDMKGNAGPVTRDDNDWLARRLGTYTNKEVVERNRNYVMKREGQERSQRLGSAMSKAVDLILSDPQGFQRRLDPIFKDLEKDRFSSDDIKNGLKRELLSKIIESDVKMLGHGNSSRQQTLIQLYQQLK